MEDNTNVSTVDTGDWDSAIGEVSFNDDPDTDDYTLETPDEQPEADPPKADTQEENKPADTPTETPPTEQGTPPEADLSFELKHLGEVRKVNKDEIITLAQKGLDYDRIREKLAANTERNESIEALAKEMGVTTDDFIESAWLSFYQSKGLDADTAREKAAIAKEKREIAREKAAKAEAEKQLQSEEAAKQAEEARKQKEFTSFIAKRPDVKAEDIPPAVWADFKSGMPLLAAYALYENAKLKTELEAAKKNAANAAKSTGSKATAGNKTGGNDLWSQIENDWNSD